jgi:AAA15 family ATPase/GTPase
MYENIKISNLRGITELSFDNLAQVNLIVGNNACGKTTLLEGIFFLIGAMNPLLPVNANIFRNLPFMSNVLWDTYFHNMNANTPIRIEGQVRGSTEKERLVIRPRKSKPHRDLNLTANSDVLVTPPGDSETSLKLEGLNFEYSTSKHPEKAITTSIFIEKDKIVTEGEKSREVRGVFLGPATPKDWKERFATVQRNKKLDEVISLLRQLEPKTSDLRLNEVGFVEIDADLPRLIPANLMGGGFEKLLEVALTMLNFQNGIVLIDEIENGLHHSVQQKLWDAVLNWAHALNVQVFATTHSNECIKSFNKSLKGSLFKSQAKLFRIERKDDIFRSVEYTSELLNESLESDWEVR